MLLQSPRIDDEADPITRCGKYEIQSECIRKGCTLTFYIELLYPTLSNGITLHRLSSGGSGGSESEGQAVLGRQ